MKNKQKWNFWEFISKLILKNRIIFILLIIALTIFFSSHWKNVQFTFTEANLLPADHPENIKYSSFKNYFGEEGNIISIGINDSIFLNKKNQKLWNDLNYKLSNFEEIESILSTNNLIELKKDSKNKKLIAEKIKIDSKEKLFNELMIIGEKISNFIKPVWKFLNEEIKNNKKILFEGAQGSMLDVDFGTYPFVTSSSTTAAAAALGSGVAHNKINSVLGITKAYTTRVGEGPMPTELFDSFGQYLAVEGNEKGTVTGRDRRCGWFDAPLVRRSCVLNGVTSLALTKIDVLDKLEKIKICIGYRVEQEECSDFPVSTSLANKLSPIYEEIDGWNTSTVGLEKIDQMPIKARKYIQRIEELAECKVSIISTGPERSQTILINNPFLV